MDYYNVFLKSPFYRGCVSSSAMVAMAPMNFRKTCKLAIIVVTYHIIKSLYIGNFIPKFHFALKEQVTVESGCISQIL